MRSRVLVLLIGITVWVLDRLAKAWALSALADGTRIHIVGDAVQLQLTANSGAAFSMGSGFTWAFTLLASAVVLAILWFAPRVTHNAWIVGLGGLAGGASGNLTDRLTRPPSFGAGHVVDFIAFPHFPVFNVADMAIVGAVSLMFLLSWRGIPTSSAA